LLFIMAATAAWERVLRDQREEFHQITSLHAQARDEMSQKNASTMKELRNAHIKAMQELIEYRTQHQIDRMVELSEIHSMHQKQLTVEHIIATGHLHEMQNLERVQQLNVQELARQHLLIQQGFMAGQAQARAQAPAQMDSRGKPPRPPAGHHPRWFMSARR
jgi:CHASE3 domain sensor protein